MFYKNDTFKSQVQSVGKLEWIDNEGGGGGGGGVMVKDA